MVASPTHSFPIDELRQLQQVAELATSHVRFDAKPLAQLMRRAIDAYVAAAKTTPAPRVDPELVGRIRKIAEFARARGYIAASIDLLDISDLLNAIDPAGEARGL